MRSVAGTASANPAAKRTYDLSQLGAAKKPSKKLIVGEDVKFDKTPAKPLKDWELPIGAVLVHAMGGVGREHTSGKSKTTYEHRLKTTRYNR